MKYLFVGLVMNAVIKGLTTDLPQNALFWSMDYSEVFSLEPFEQLQSLYYSTQIVRILVIVTMRHAVRELDGEESTADNFIPVFENWFYIAHHLAKQAWPFSQFAVRHMLETMIRKHADVQVCHHDYITITPTTTPTKNETDHPFP